MYHFLGVFRVKDAEILYFDLKHFNANLLLFQSREGAGSVRSQLVADDDEGSLAEPRLLHHLKLDPTEPSLLQEAALQLFITPFSPRLPGQKLTESHEVGVIDGQLPESVN